MCVRLFLSWDRLTAFVLRSFAQAKTYIPKTVDMDILNSAVEFLFTRQNRGNGLFFEQGRVIHDEMQVRGWSVGWLGGWLIIFIFVKRYSLLLIVESLRCSCMRLNV